MGKQTTTETSVGLELLNFVHFGKNFQIIIQMSSRLRICISCLHVCIGLKKVFGQDLPLVGYITSFPHCSLLHTGVSHLSHSSPAHVSVLGTTAANTRWIDALDTQQIINICHYTYYGATVQDSWPTQIPRPTILLGNSEL